MTLEAARKYLADHVDGLDCAVEASEAIEKAFQPYRDQFDACLPGQRASESVLRRLRVSLDERSAAKSNRKQAEAIRLVLASLPNPPTTPERSET